MCVSVCKCEDGDEGGDRDGQVCLPQYQNMWFYWTITLYNLAMTTVCNIFSNRFQFDINLYNDL